MHQVLSQVRAVSPVGLDQALIDAPGGLDRSVVLAGDQNLETPGLAGDEQAGSGVQGAPGRGAGSIRASARLSDLTPPELHEGRDPLAEWSGVLHRVRGFVQYAQPPTNTPPPSCSRPL